MAEEILAGARNQPERIEYRQFFGSVERVGRASAPEHSDWIRAGELLARYSWRWGVLEPARHLNDVLILLTTRRLGAEVLTRNVQDMLVWARMLDARERQVAVVSPEDL